jgi:HD-like signal output (HDOD) protein
MDFLAPTLSIIVVGGALLLLLHRRNSRNGSEGPTKPRGEGPKKVAPTDPIVLPWEQILTQEKITDSYKELQDINYSPVKQGVELPLLSDIDEGIKSSVKEIVSSSHPIPTTSLRLLNLLRDPKSSSREISSIISTNPIFSAKILQTANSAFFRRSDKISSVGRAITLLGYNNIRALVIQDTLCNALPGRIQTAVGGFNEIWIHSAVVSTCASFLDRQFFTGTEYELATIGLLHDIGKYFLPLLEKRGERNLDMPIIIQEQDHYGINHALLGSLIAQYWQLPDVIARSIEYHHHPTYAFPDLIPEAHRKASFIACLSDLVSKALGYKGRDHDMFPVRIEYFDLFKTKPLITPELIREVEKANLTIESYIKTL